MDVFGKGTAEPSRPLLSPGVCWICDQSPIQEEYRVIDTRRNTQAGGAMSHLSNRKYICEPCALEMGGAMGMVSPEEAATLDANAKDFYDRMVEAQDELEQVRSQQLRVVAADGLVDEFTSLLRDELAKTVKKAPAKKSAATDA